MMTHLLLALCKMVFKIRRRQLRKLLLRYLPSELGDLLAEVYLTSATARVETSVGSTLLPQTGTDRQ